MDILISFSLINYLVCSFSPAIFISRFLIKKDIRKIGHKTAGGSNAIHVLGLKWGILVGLIDILKSVPILIISSKLGADSTMLTVIALFGIAGHCWPIWYKFSGGRGVATVIGSNFVLTPKINLILIVILLGAIIAKPLRSKLKDNHPGIALFINSAIFTLTYQLAYLLVLIFVKSEYVVFALISILIILIRRISANLSDYKRSDPQKVFISRLIFDNSDTISNAL